MYTDGLFSRKELLDGIVHDSSMLLKEKLGETLASPIATLTGEH